MTHSRSSVMVAGSRPADFTGQRPRMFLLGWAGCQERHLAKYVDLYDRLGIDAVSFTDHCNILQLCVPGKLEALANDLLTHAVVQRPVGVHVFSNGGAFLWSRALRVAVERQLTRTGTVPIFGSLQILDSTPGSLSDLKGGWHFLNEITMGGPLPARLGLLFLYPIVVSVLVIVYVILLQWVSDLSVEQRWKRAWAANAAACGIVAHLYLFSADDLLIKAESVREFGDLSLQTPAERTVTVSRITFEPSKHVQHYRLHPDRYQRSLSTFLRQHMCRMESSREGVKMGTSKDIRSHHRTNGPPAMQ